MSNTRKKIIFILSVDTEEEFDWGGAFPQRDCRVENIRFLPEFHGFCQTLGVRPTYLVDYPVAAAPESARVLRDIQATACAEIGAHLHPWCTPPIEGGNSERESHVINLPENLIRQKLDALIKAIQSGIGVRPTVFRTGRWGIDGKVLQILIDYGFVVDTSVYPFYANQFFSCEGASNVPYWPDMAEPNLPGDQRRIYEIPITSGFNRANFAMWGKIHRAMSTGWKSSFRLVGFAWHTRLLRKLFLSPELSTADDMIDLINASVASGNPVVHMFLHSSTLLEAKGAYNRQSIGRSQLYARIRTVIDYLRVNTDMEFCTVTEAATRLQSR